jgi:hypothetical protein
MQKSRFVLFAALIALAVTLAGCGGAAKSGGTSADCPGISQPAASGPGAFDGEDGYSTVQKGPLKLGGASCSSTITDVNSADNWTFDGKADQTIVISVKAQGDTDPELTVIDPTGEVIDADDDGGGGTNPLLNTTLPDDGVYTLRVDTFTEGAYTIDVTTGTPEP